MGMRYNFGKVLLIGSSSILVLEATVCILRKWNTCFFARKNSCTFCEREKRQSSKKSGSRNCIQGSPGKNYHNFTVVSGLIKTMISIMKASARSRQHSSNSGKFSSEEILIDEMKRKENMEIESTVHGISVPIDRYYVPLRCIR